jgi:hypothetical protein
MWRPAWMPWPRWRLAPHVRGHPDKYTSLSPISVSLSGRAAGLRVAPVRLGFRRRSCGGGVAASRVGGNGGIKRVDHRRWWSRSVSGVSFIGARWWRRRGGSRFACSLPHWPSCLRPPCVLQVRHEDAKVDFMEC